MPLLRNTGTGFIDWYLFDSQQTPVVQQVQRTKHMIGMSSNPTTIDIYSTDLKADHQILQFSFQKHIKPASNIQCNLLKM